MYTFMFVFQARFSFNVSKWDSIKPALYHGHIAFVDFAKYVELYSVLF